MVCQYEADLIRSGLKKCSHNMTDTARYLGLERSLLYKKMKKLNISIKKEI